KKFVCHHSRFQKVPRDQNKKGISKNAECHSSIFIKVKLDTPKTREVDDFVREQAIVPIATTVEVSSEKENEEIKKMVIMRK
ncbi:hypothetical protein JTE90_016962, partial [Oedothorax gibbosus]